MTTIVPLISHRVNQSIPNLGEFDPPYDSSLALKAYDQSTKEDSSSISYDSLRKLDWQKILTMLIITLFLTIIILAIVNIVKPLDRCSKVFWFLVTYLIVLLVVGDRFLRNLSVLVLEAIILTTILTITAFFIFNASKCY